MGRRVLRRYIWGYSVCLCPIKRTQGLYGLTRHVMRYREACIHMDNKPDRPNDFMHTIDESYADIMTIYSVNKNDKYNNR